MLVSIHNGGVLFYRTLKFKYNNGNTVNKHDAVGYSALIVSVADLKLIYYLENVVLGSVEINKLNVKVFLASIFSVEDKAIANHFVNRLICLINRARHAFEH